MPCSTAKRKKFFFKFLKVTPKVTNCKFMENHEVGEKGGERHQSRPPLALGAPPVQDPKGANVGADPFPSSPENGLFIEKEKHKESQLARLFWFFVCLPPN